MRVGLLMVLVGCAVRAEPPEPGREDVGCLPFAACLDASEREAKGCADRSLRASWRSCSIPLADVVVDCMTYSEGTECFAFAVWPESKGAAVTGTGANVAEACRASTRAMSDFCAATCGNDCWRTEPCRFGVQRGAGPWELHSFGQCRKKPRELVIEREKCPLRAGGLECGCCVEAPEGTPGEFATLDACLAAVTCDPGPDCCGDPADPCGWWGDGTCDEGCAWGEDVDCP